MPMNFAALDRRCTIVAPSVTKDEYGGEVTSWVVLASVYCSIYDIMPRNDETINDQGSQTSMQRSKLRIRYSRKLACVGATHRVIMFRQGVKRAYRIVSEGAELGDKDGIEFQIERMSSGDEMDQIMGV